MSSADQTASTSEVKGGFVAKLHPKWRQSLQKSLRSNRSQANAKYVQLATIRRNGTPANRTIVFRGFLDDADTMWFVTDARSEKAEQIDYRNSGELAWYFNISREQYRVHGSLTLVKHDDPSPELQRLRKKAWFDVSPATRTQFAWRAPGLPKGEDKDGWVHQGELETLESEAAHARSKQQDRRGNRKAANAENSESNVDARSGSEQATNAGVDSPQEDVTEVSEKETAPQELSIPKPFSLLLLEPVQVDLLDLKKNLRWKYVLSSDGGWEQIEVNP